MNMTSKQRSMLHIGILSFIAFFVISMAVSTFNKIQVLDESVNTAWADVVNQYQRRADLIPNLVQIVQRYASHEKDTFVGIADARAKVGTMQANPNLAADPATMQKFVETQGQLGNFLSRLMMVKEQYPELKADKQFIMLQAQLEGTENRITVSRDRYIKSVQAYNLGIRPFPTNIVASTFGYTTKPQFTVQNEQAISTAPKVEFK